MAGHVLTSAQWDCSDASCFAGCACRSTCAEKQNGPRGAVCFECVGSGGLLLIHAMRFLGSRTTISGSGQSTQRCNGDRLTLLLHEVPTFGDQHRRWAATDALA